MSTIATRDEAVLADVVHGLTGRLRLTDDGTLYVRRYVAWRLLNNGRPDRKWTKRPRCRFPISAGAYLRHQAERDLGAALESAGRQLNAPPPGIDP